MGRPDERSADDLKWRISKLSDQQKSILSDVGIRTPAVISLLAGPERFREKLTQMRIGGALLSAAMQAARSGEAEARRLLNNMEALRATSGRDGQIVYSRRPYVLWQPEVILGANPASTRRESLSRALRRLEAGGYLTRLSGAPATARKGRTLKVRLTATGASMSFAVLAAAFLSGRPSADTIYQWHLAAPPETFGPEYDATDKPAPG